MPTVDDLLKDLKHRTDIFFSKAYNERELARELINDGCYKESNEHTLQAMRYSSQAEALMQEYKKLGGV